MALYEHLALEGGGAKGYIYIGVAKELARLGILDKLHSIAGASVGAIGALVLSTGWSIEKMEKTFLDLDFSAMAQGGWKGALLSPYTAANYYGLHDADAFLQLFKKIIKEVTGNENTTFEEWHQLKEKRPELGLKDIVVEACNLNTKLNETFSYLTQHKDVPIAEAIRASMAFPVYFTPMKIKGCFYGDGGEQKNCPSDDFEEEPGTFNPKVLSIRLDDVDEIKYFEEGVRPPPTPINNFLECSLAHFESALNAQNYAFHQSPYKANAIFCDTLKIGTLKFDLSKEEKDALIASGQYAVIRYFRQKHPELAKAVYGKDDKVTLKLVKSAPVSFMDFIRRQPKESFEENEEEANSSPSSSNVVTPMYRSWCKLAEVKKMHQAAALQGKATVEDTKQKDKQKVSMH